MAGTGRIAANGNRRFDDEDDAALAESAALHALVREKRQAYVGRTDLLELAIATCLELRRIQGEFDRFSHDEGRREHGHALLQSCKKIGVELEAMSEAMDRDTQLKLSEAIKHLPLPGELVS